MRLTAYKLAPDAPTLRPGVPARDWMDMTGERFAYRCLPLTTANAHGWELLCPASFEAYWNGGPRPKDIVIKPIGAPSNFAMSHFGNGVITFHSGYLFRTEEAHNLYVTGPINRPKDGISALTGIVETDWLPYPFTMNWVFTAPGGPVIFEEGEPFCHLFPVRRALVEEVTPQLLSIHDDPALQERFQQWSTSRAHFNRDLGVEGSEAAEQRWQKHYTRGEHPDGERGSEDHRTKLRVRPFVAPAPPAAPRGFDANGIRRPDGK